MEKAKDLEVCSGDEKRGEQEHPVSCLSEERCAEDSKHMKFVFKLIIREGSGLPAIICL